MRERRILPGRTRTSVGIVVALAVIFGIAGLAQEATAAGLDKKGSADAKKATQLYKQGNYEEAATIFLQLSVDNPGMPVFVRNLGACYYYLRRPDPALSNLREYLHKKKDITPEDSAEVERWIAEMDQLRQRGGTATPAPGPVPPAVPTATPAPASTAPGTPWPPATGQTVPSATPEMPPAHSEGSGAPPQSPAAYAPYPAQPSPYAPYPAQSAEYAQYPAPPNAYAPYPAPPAATPPAPGSAEAVTQMPQPAESGGRNGRTVAAWVLGGAGVALLAMGGAFTYVALTDFSDIQTQYDPSKESQGKTFAALQWLGYGLGGAAIVTAVILIATVRDTPKSGAIAPAVGPGSAGAALSGSF